MRIVIEIEPKKYEAFMNDWTFTTDILHAVRNGIPLPAGHWISRHIIDGNKTIDMHYCSECGEEFSYDAETGVNITNYNTCPNCGAKMEVKADVS